nr:MAG: replication associated protein [Arizlama virus]
MSETRNEVGGNTNPHRSWCFTMFEKPEFKNEFIRYMIYQKELAPSTEKVHFQGYLELTHPEKLSWMKKLSNSAHWEPRRGTREQARDYCRKTETQVEPPVEMGEWIKGQGNRSDLNEVCDYAKNHSMRDVAEEYPSTYVKYYKGLNELKGRLADNKAMRNLEVIVLWGDTGVGKTRYVYDNEKIEDIFKLDYDNEHVWFDGYNGEKVLLLDDFYGWIKWTMILNLLDRYPMRLPIKGSFTYAQWTKVYITSNKPPEEWYCIKTEPLMRRITKVIHMEASSPSVNSL